MSFSFTRDRTAELRDSHRADPSQRSSDEFGPQRTPAGFRQPMLNPVDRYPAQLPPRTGARDTMDEQDVYEMHNVKTDISTLEGFFDEVERLRNEISIVSDNVDKITTLHKSTLVSFNEQQTRELSNDLERIQNGTRKKTVEIKNRIQDLELSNARLPNDSNTQIRRTQTATLRKRFLEVIQRYQDIERTYQQKYRQHIVRQIHIVKPDATQDEIDAVIDSDQPPQLFSQSLMQASRMGEAREVLSEVQSRHDDIKRIEKTIVELHQLFMDMSMLVENQGVVLGQIQNNAETTTGNLEQGNQFIAKAIQSAKSTRAKKWCCFFIVIIICVVIAILVWWFGFGHPGVGNNQTTQ